MTVGAPVSSDLSPELPSWVESTVESMAYQDTQDNQHSVHPSTLHTLQQHAWMDGYWKGAYRKIHNRAPHLT
jgi:hypothetical protein